MGTAFANSKTSQHEQRAAKQKSQSFGLHGCGMLRFVCFDALSQSCTFASMSLSCFLLFAWLPARINRQLSCFLLLPLKSYQL